MPPQETSQTPAPVPSQTQTTDNSTVLGILAYLGPLVIVSYLMGKDNAFVKYHVKQGLVLLVLDVIVWFIAGMFWAIWMLMNLVHLALLVLTIIGIINVVNKKQQPLPLVGQFAHYFNF